MDKGKAPDCLGEEGWNFKDFALDSLLRAKWRKLFLRTRFKGEGSKNKTLALAATGVNTLGEGY